MRIGRTLSPAAAPISFSNILSGFGAITRGDAAIEQFRQELKDYFRAEHCFLASSGKAALLLVLEALKGRCPERNQVLIPALNCFSVPSAIVRAGLKVTLCDIDHETLDFDFTQLRDKLNNPQLLCVIPTHLFGRPADVLRLRSMLKDSRVVIVEDAAQAFGGVSAGYKLGMLGDIGLFSLGRGKALSTVGGGIILTSCPELARQIGSVHARLLVRSRLRTVKLILYALAIVVLQRPLLFWLPNALPFLKLGQTVYDPLFELERFTAFQAGIARGWQRKIALFKDIRKRQVLALVGVLEGLAQVHYGCNKGEVLSLIRLPWKVESRDCRSRIIEKSKQFGLGISVIYPSSITHIHNLKKDFMSESHPVADDCSKTLVTLPVHPFVRLEDRNRIERFLREMIMQK